MPNLILKPISTQLKKANLLQQWSQVVQVSRHSLLFCADSCCVLNKRLEIVIKVIALLTFWIIVYTRIRYMFKYLQWILCGVVTWYKHGGIFINN